MPDTQHDPLRFSTLHGHTGGDSVSTFHGPGMIGQWWTRNQELDSRFFGQRSFQIRSLESLINNLRYKTLFCRSSDSMHDAWPGDSVTVQSRAGEAVMQVVIDSPGEQIAGRCLADHHALTCQTTVQWTTEARIDILVFSVSTRARLAKRVYGWWRKPGEMVDIALSSL